MSQDPDTRPDDPWRELYAARRADGDPLPPHPDRAAEMGRAVLIGDPVERARELTRTLALAQLWVEWGSYHRDKAITEMRAQGASYDHVAAALGITKSRAAQISKRLDRASRDA